MCRPGPYVSPELTWALSHVPSHGPEQMYYVLEGEGAMTVGTETENVGAGDCIFIPSNAPHGLENTGASLLRYFSAASPSFGREETERFWPLNSMKDEHE